MSEETVRGEDIQIPASSQSTLDLIPRRGSSSLAWRWFGFERSDVSQKTPICKLCRKSVAVKGSSTSNLFHHLRTTHHSEYENYEKLRETESAEHDAPAADRVKKTRNKLWPNHLARKYLTTEKAKDGKV